MLDNEMKKLYLEKLIHFCEDYNSFFIPAAMLAGGAGIRLQDVYTQLEVVTRKEYEKNEDTLETLRADTNSLFDGTRSVETFETDLQDIIRRINAKIAELEAHEKNGDISPDDTENSAKDDEDTSEEPEDNNGNDTSSDNFTPERDDKMRWLLAAPGGGKTTLLKMLTFTYAFRIYTNEFGKYLIDEPKIIEKCEEVCQAVEECIIYKCEDGKYPVFIKVREIDEAKYKNISTDEDLESLIMESMDRLIGDASFDAQKFFKSNDNWVFIVDGVEEFVSSSVRSRFLKVLSEYATSNGIRCFLSSRYQEKLDSEKDELDIIEENDNSDNYTGGEQFVIKELSLESSIVHEFVEGWYAALNNISGRKAMDVDRDFIIPLKNNSNIAQIITNPLELTSLLMISSYDSYLPSDFSRIYGRSIELWLSWGNYLRYNIEDMLRQLAQVAYKMVTSDDRIITVKHDVLVEYIRQARTDLKRYYQQQWGEDEGSINDFIQFLCRSHLISENAGEYEFVHRQYQAYLVAYCIKNNLFSRETRKARRFDYIEPFIEERDAFWNQIIFIIATIDIDLRDSIIGRLLELAQDENEKRINYRELTNSKRRISPIPETGCGYYISRLIELSIIPGINFDLEEKRKLFQSLLCKHSRLSILNRKKIDLFKLFEMNDSESNDLFINIAAENLEKFDDFMKADYSSKLASCIFSCIWNYDVSDESFVLGMESFLQDYLSIDIISTIYNEKIEKIDKKHKEDLIIETGRKDLLAGKDSDFYLIIALFYAYREGIAPYEAVDRLLKENTYESRLIACSILSVGAWLIGLECDNKYGFNVGADYYNNYSEFILRGICDDKYKNTNRDYLSAFADIFKLGIMKSDGNWFSEEVLEYVLNMEVERYSKTGSVIEGHDRLLSGELYHIARYPLKFSSKLREMLCKSTVDYSKFASEIYVVFNTSDDARNTVFAFKLLTLLAYDDNSRLQIVKDMKEHAEKDERIKFKLNMGSLSKEYALFMNQINEWL